MKNNVLIPVNLENENMIALEQATHVAKLFKLDIFLLFVIEESGLFSKFFSDKQKKEIEKSIELKLKEVAEQTEKTSGCKTRYLIKRGRVSSEILNTADELDSKYIFMKTITSKEENPSISVNAFRVLRRSEIPVFSINGKGHYDGIRNILLPLDMSNETMHKVASAVELAEKYKAAIQVVSVVEGDDEMNVPSKINMLVQQVKKFIQSSKLKCETHCIVKRKGESIVKSILNYVETRGDIDLILIMTQQEVGITGAKIGAIAQDFIKHCKIPLMTIRPLEISGGSARSF